MQRLNRTAIVLSITNESTRRSENSTTRSRDSQDSQPKCKKRIDFNSKSKQGRRITVSGCQVLYELYGENQTSKDSRRSPSGKGQEQRTKATNTSGINRFPFIFDNGWLIAPMICLLCIVRCRQSLRLSCNKEQVTEGTHND